MNETTGAPIDQCTDLLLNGAPMASLVAHLPNLTIGHSSTPTQSVTVSGNYANAHHDGACKRYTGAFAYAAAGVIFEANHASSCQSKKFPTAPVCSTLEAGPTVANDTVRVALNTGAFAAPRPTLS